MTTLADAAIADLVHSLDIECLAKGTVLIRQGEPVSASNYLVSGCLRQFLTTTVGKEVSVAFYLENEAVNTAGGIDSEGLSLYSYECVENLLRPFLRERHDSGASRGGRGVWGHDSDAV